MLLAMEPSRRWPPDLRRTPAASLSRISTNAACQD